MKNWEEDDGTEYCTAKEDLADAQSVADRLKIPLRTANFAAEYWDDVFEHFLHEYRAGRTPNPDILCNREIKFGLSRLRPPARRRSHCTGHYVRLMCQRQVASQRALTQKDQSYFLHQVNHRALEKPCFP